MAILRALSVVVRNKKKGNLWYLLLLEQNTDSKQAKKKEHKHRKIKVSYTGGLINYTRYTKRSRNVQDLIKEMKTFYFLSHSFAGNE